MTIQSIGSALHRFFKKETVLCLSFLAAVYRPFLSRRIAATSITWTPGC